MTWTSSSGPGTPPGSCGHDNSGGSVSRARLDGRDWHITGDSERFSGTVTADGTRIAGVWERLDQGEWVRWMEVALSSRHR